MHKIISVALLLCFFVVPVNAAQHDRDRIGSNQKDTRSENARQTMPRNKPLENRKEKVTNKKNDLIRKKERFNKTNWLVHTPAQWN